MQSKSFDLDSLHRPAYCIMLYVLRAVTYWAMYDTGTGPVDRAGYIAFAALPGLWFWGLLPPLDAFLAWIAEQVSLASTMNLHMGICCAHADPTVSLLCRPARFVVGPRPSGIALEPQLSYPPPPHTHTPTHPRHMSLRITVPGHHAGRLTDGHRPAALLDGGDVVRLLWGDLCVA